MDIKKTIDELGPFTVIDTLSKIGTNLSPIAIEMARFLPISPMNHKNQLGRIKSAFIKEILYRNQVTKKEKIIVVGPELILIEALVSILPEVIIYLIVDDQHLNSDQLERIRVNIPLRAKVYVFTIPTVPMEISPSESLLFVPGLHGGANYALVRESSRAIINFFENVYYGEKVLICPFSFPVQSRPEGWVTINIEPAFTDVFGVEYYGYGKSNHERAFK